jgi:hypothetical protein
LRKKKLLIYVIIIILLGLGVYRGVNHMDKRKAIIEVLKQIKPLIINGDGPTSIFIAGGKAGEDFRKLNINNLSGGKESITVTTGRFLFKRKYRINKDEI